VSSHTHLEGKKGGKEGGNEGGKGRKEETKELFYKR